MQNIIIIGNGKLSDAVMKNFHLYSGIPVKSFSEGVTVSGQTIFVHMGSGRQYDEALKIAIGNNSSFIQASTEKDIPMKVPIRGDFKYISAPNLDLNIIRLFYLLSLAGDLFSGETVTVTESHQKEKASKPGTAIKICGYLNCPEEHIVSIREPEKQKEMGISNLGQHAYHEIKIGSDQSSISFTTKVEGADGYVKGLARIVESVKYLDYGIYEIDDLFRKNIL